MNRVVTTEFEPGILGPALTLLARLTGRVWFWYRDPVSNRRRLYFGRLS